MTSVPSCETSLSGIAHFEKSRFGMPGVNELVRDCCTVADEDDCDGEAIELEYGGGLSSLVRVVGVVWTVGLALGFPILVFSSSCLLKE